MVERIYDTIKAILYTDFPKNNQGFPCVYDRVVQYWFFGDETIHPSPLGIVLRGTTSGIKDIGYGLREIEYSIGLTFYSSNDDQPTSERVVQESARIAHSILKNHRTMWVCELCPFTGNLPLSPIHYIDNGVITNVGINTAVLPPGQSYYKIMIPATGVGYTANAYVKLSPGISGKVTVSEILSCGLGINTTQYSDMYSNLTFTLSKGTSLSGFATSVMISYLQNVVSQTNNYWSETHSSSSPEYLDWSGSAYKAVQEFISDWKAGIQPPSIAGISSWYANINTVVNTNTDLMRLLQDIQVGDIKPSDDGEEKAFLHNASFTFKAKEIISVDTFGPNNVNVNSI